MKFAKVENNIVTNVIIADTEEFASSIGYILIPDEFGIGDIFKDNIFIKNKDTTINKAKENALQRISGKCSASIEKGLDIEGKHYSFPQLAQTDIPGCMQELRNGASVVPYQADGEVDYNPYNLEQMTAVYTTMSEWIKVNTQYKATLKKWIAREESKDVLNSIDYGIMLPDDLFQELGTKLAVYGVNIKKYALMLTQKQEVQNENK